MSIFLDPEINYNSFVAKKPMSSYPKSALQEINLLSVSHEGEYIARPFGSYTFRIQRYPGDLDLIENIDPRGSKDQIIKKVETTLKKIVKKIVSQRLHYYSEIKVGYDYHYGDWRMSFGTMEYGIFIPNSPSDKKFPNLKKYFNQEDRKIIEKMLLGNTSNNYDVISYIVRQYYILRWSSFEIEKGKKKLHDGSFITLNDALRSKSLTKIDEISVIDDKFVEITNLYVLSYTDISGKHKFISPEPNEVDDIKEEIEKLYYSDVFYNPFKIVKRMFSVSRRPENKFDPKYRAIVKTLIPFISSDTSAMYQLKSELETLLIIYERFKEKKIKSIPQATINKQLNEMKIRLAYILEFPKEELLEFNRDIDQIIIVKKIDTKMDIIEKITKILKKHINRDTIVFLNYHKLNPIPDFFMPNFHLYDRNIKRKPDSNPINPVELAYKNMNVNANKEIADPQERLANTILGTTPQTQVQQALHDLMDNGRGNYNESELYDELSEIDFMDFSDIPEEHEVEVLDFSDMPQFNHQNPDSDFDFDFDFENETEEPSNRIKPPKQIKAIIPMGFNIDNSGEGIITI